VLVLLLLLLLAQTARHCRSTTAIKSKLQSPTSSPKQPMCTLLLLLQQPLLRACAPFTTPPCNPCAQAQLQ
jgi:hypothetical protein